MDTIGSIAAQLKAGIPEPISLEEIRRIARELGIRRPAHSIWVFGDAQTKQILREYRKRWKWRAFGKPRRARARRRAKPASSGVGWNAKIE